MVLGTGTSFAQKDPVEALGDEAKGQNDNWRFSVTPYLWLPTVNGTIKSSMPSGSLRGLEAKVGSNNYLDYLNVAIMLAGEVRKGKWSIYADVIYLDFSKEKSEVQAAVYNSSGRIPINTSLNTDTKSSLRGLVWNLLGTYRLLENPIITLDGMGGVRYFGLQASTDWQLSAAVNGPRQGETLARSGEISGREDIWDAIVGVRGRVRLGSSNWFVPYYFDVGTGTSIVTWQGLLGIGYSYKWIEGTIA
jgi:hypothetical protein